MMRLRRVFPGTSVLCLGLMAGPLWGQSGSGAEPARVFRMGDPSLIPLQITTFSHRLPLFTNQPLALTNRPLALPSRPLPLEEGSGTAASGSSTAYPNPGSLRLALGEALLSNFIPWAFNEYVSQYKDITRISPTRWKENVAAGFQWDDNHFHINMLMHPYAGSLSYNAGRTNSYRFESSFLFSLFASAFWECCGESHRPSPGDLLSTTIGGTALGEVLYRWTSQLLNHAYFQDPPNRWWEAPVAVLDPTRGVTRWILGRYVVPEDSLVSPSSWAIVGKGIPFTSGKEIKPFAEVDYTYGDVVSITRKSSPFDHFETAVELAHGDSAQLIGRVQARGNLWSKRWTGQGLCLVPTTGGALPGCFVRFGNILPFIGFDYINNPAYEFGGQSLGVATFLTIGRYPGGSHMSLSLDGQGLFGAVKSEHAYLGQLHDERSERDREYDFTLGAGWGAGAIGAHRRLRARAFYRVNKHWVVNGSNVVRVVNGKKKLDRTIHKTRLMGVEARFRLWGRLGVGASFRRYQRRSVFSSSLEPAPIRKTHDLWSAFLSLEQVRPLGLFVF